MVIEVKVKEALVEQYQRDGAVLVKKAFHQDWVEKVRQGIAKNLQKPSQYSQCLMQGKGAYFNDFCNWPWIHEFRDYVYDSPAASIAAAFMKSSSVVFYHEHVLNKEPGTEKRTPWHQDQPYYPIDGDKVCSLWMPVDPVSLETCVQFVAGSHLWPRWFIPRMFATESNYPLKESQQEQEEEFGKERARRYYDVPVEEIESNKWPILQWECEVKTR
ncbi:uncharacterized protein LOC121857661 [Homarus americanus]|uniref:uncharacterized protein LOC121857661 n=1 Tax=Homarus americanus TaxID=6706 RepID=UPI001C4935FA|nr:uncharacterized protein LOC121857661 [Homarus americanus]XP_042209667.1 uncharacterized protein LOC121857661 [Homarus americanus]XP_042209675.1 uncharacterized protein LOC121857661 [Homarus americanus]